MSESGSAPETQPVIDDVAGHRFVVHEGSADAELVYRARPGRLILIHTEVPPELGGRGLGARLVLAALERARRTGETVVPWCPFARRWITEHPGAVAGLDIDWSEPPPRRAS
jgi:hypothetical protein